MANEGNLHERKSARFRTEMQTRLSTSVDDLSEREDVVGPPRIAQHTIYELVRDSSDKSGMGPWIEVSPRR